MNCIDQTYDSPAENLAADEALLELAESQGVEYLRFWESRTHFIVLGRSNSLSKEVNLTESGAKSIPVLRRSSGGGTVVQGPGCLNYALILRIPEAGPLASITGTNQHIMEVHRRAMEQLTGAPISIRGFTDLETGGLKFSGNAQRRGRNALLFHGTLLYAADLGLFSSVLNHPSLEPDWRKQRPHSDFITNLPGLNSELGRSRIIDSLRRAWNAGPLNSLKLDPQSFVTLTTRHLSKDWIHSRP